MNIAEIKRFEEISNNAWPALQTVSYDGWLLRFAAGVTKRSNSVSLLYPSTIDPPEKIRFCESLYLRQGIIPCFKITPAAGPEGIDDLLGANGYFIHSTVSFQLLNIANTGGQIPEGTETGEELNADWIGHFIRMNDFDVQRKPVYIRIMQQMITPKCLVTVRSGSEVMAVGLGVLEDHYLGIFDLVVAPEHRRKGLAQRVMQAIIHWGTLRGARTAYLQVLTNNDPAMQLYRQLGFTEFYRYWYRMKQL